mmetsp:Transcript_168752/g.542351  ORF Transcript_168752/g.542351 Transcript_168752/m.542351 type:complete len:340 (+) Transcript_168752:718-1737(+)
MVATLRVIHEEKKALVAARKVHLLFDAPVRHHHRRPRCRRGQRRGHGRGRCRGQMIGIGEREGDGQRRDILEEVLPERQPELGQLRREPHLRVHLADETEEDEDAGRIDAVVHRLRVLLLGHPPAIDGGQRVAKLHPGQVSPPLCSHPSDLDALAVAARERDVPPGLVARLVPHQPRTSARPLAALLPGIRIFVRRRAEPVGQQAGVRRLDASQGRRLPGRSHPRRRARSKPLPPRHGRHGAALARCGGEVASAFLGRGGTASHRGQPVHQAQRRVLGVVLDALVHRPQRRQGRAALAHRARWGPRHRTLRCGLEERIRPHANRGANLVVHGGRRRGVW